MTNKKISEKIILDEPIKRKDETITEVQVRKPAPSELRGLSVRDLIQTDANSMITILPRLTVPILEKEEVENMDVGDFTALANEVASFLFNTASKEALGIK